MEWPAGSFERGPNQEHFYMRSTNFTNCGPPADYSYGDAGRMGTLNFGQFNISRMPQTIAAEARNDYTRIFEWAAVHSKEFVPAALRTEQPVAPPEDQFWAEPMMSERDYFEQMSRENQMMAFQNIQIDLPKIEFTPPPPSEDLSPASPTQKSIAQLFKEKVWARAQESNKHVLYHENDPDELSFKGFKKQVTYPDNSDSGSSGSVYSDSGSSGSKKWKKKTSGSPSAKTVNDKCETQEKNVPMTKNKRFGFRR